VTADISLAALEELAAAPTSSPATPGAGTQRVVAVLDDGSSWELTLDARDRRAYALMADRYKLPAFTLDPESGAVDVLRLELLTVFSAWHAARHRLGLYSRDWPAWNAELVELTIIGDAPEVAPHPPERGAG